MIRKNIISIKRVSKNYKAGSQNIRALSNIDFDVKKGEFVAIIGPSGSGKSTLMHIIGLLDIPTKGKYFLNGNDVGKIDMDSQAEIRNKEIGFVFQQFNLLPRTSVWDNILLPTLYGGIKNKKERAWEIIDSLGLRNRVYNLSNQLSGGQIQRVAIARALMMDPSILLADEPTGNLDTKTSHELMETFKKINEEEGTTIVVITHEKEIAHYASRIVKIRDGRLNGSDI